MVARCCRLLATFLAVAFILPLAFAETAAADGRGDRYRGYGHGHYHHRHYARPYYARPYYAPYGAYLAPGVYLNLPPVVIAPPPVVFAPAPVIVQQPPVRCRSWSGSVVIGGRAQPAYGTQCLMPDGTWQLVD